MREPDRLEVLRREDAALLVMLRGLYRDGVFAPTDDEPPTPEDSTP